MRCAGILALLTFVPLAVAEEPAPSKTSKGEKSGEAKAVSKPVSADHVERAKRGLALFKSDVRKVLVENCLECHGGRSVKADFDIATREALLESGYVDETAEDSHLMLLLTHEVEPHMPFKKPKLPAKEIAAIGKWIDLGAPYDKPLAETSDGPRAMVVTETDRQFWSFRPLADVEPPAVEGDWARSAIDRFVQAKLDEEGLEPNETADRRRLIRRVTFDLTGLPPTPERVEAFVRDEHPRAYENLVDELLESPHYGERWARHWMDVARFAESHGYEQDYDRKHAYHYRDFLVKALNADMPYDQFVRWQLAGDELAPEDPLAWMATGFLGAGAFPTQLTETEFESARYDELDDIVGTMGTAFLGLTVGCARCHDHKFDPFPTVDYYRLASTFTTTIRSEVDLPIEDDETFRARLAEWETKRKSLAAALREYESGPLQKAVRAWAASPDRRSSPTTWTLLEPTKVTSKGGAKLDLQDDGAILATGPKPANDEYTFVGTMSLRGVRAIRLEALTHDSLARKGPGRAGNGNFALSEFRVTIQPLGDEASTPVPAKLVAARATHQQNAGSLSVASSIDADPVSGWAVDAGGIGKDQAAVFEFAEPVGFEGGTRIVVTMSFRNNTQHALGRFRLSVATESDLPPTVGIPVDGDLAAAFAALEEQSFDELEDRQQAVLANWFAARDERHRELAAAVASHEQARPEPRTVKVQVNSEGLPHMKHHADGRGFPHFYPQTHVLGRGDVNQKQRVAEQGFLQVLMPGGTEATEWQVDPVEPPAGSLAASADQTFRRATLANWMTDVDRGAGHLLARVVVNRLWHHHFGRGIVGTPSDFGFQGDRPTHPELLDWLARDLVEHGWSLKRTHRLIVNSATYRQSSAFDESRAAVDRENRYLWRWTPRRLEAEAIRDGMLHVSGQLDTTMYGPGTLDQNHRRRSIYFFVKRSRLIPMMMLFDWPEHLVGIGSRGTTTIAPQALAFLNGPQTRGFATGFANRLGDGSPASRVERAYMLAFSRPPSGGEVERCREFVDAQRERHAEAGVANPESAAWTDLCQLLLASNGFVYVD